jgi:aminoglycoside phosphotransferase (APT) family kinase protein
VRLLRHKPGRRAAFGVRWAGAEYVLKLLSAADFVGALGPARLGAGAAPHRLRAPRLVAHCAQHRALLLEFVPGVPLDRLGMADRAAALVALPAALAAVHAGPGAGLGRWRPDSVLGKLDALTAAVAGRSTTLARSAAELTGVLGGRLVARDGAVDAVTTHGDVTLRNLVWADRAPAGRSALGLIDWDRAALGPVEVDLSPLLGLLGAAAAALPAQYEQAGGRHVDRELLDALVVANRLTRTLKRTVLGKLDPAVAAARVAGLAGDDRGPVVVGRTTAGGRPCG